MTDNPAPTAEEMQPVECAFREGFTLGDFAGGGQADPRTLELAWQNSHSRAALTRPNLDTMPAEGAESELVDELERLIVANDTDRTEAERKHGFVGAWAMTTALPLANWLWDNRHAILAALRTHAAAAERDEAKLLRTCFDAIKSLPEDALGYAEDDCGRWPIRDELLSNIDAALRPSSTTTEGER